MKSYRGFLILLSILFILMIITNEDYGITWDEPLYYQAGDSYFSWVKSSLHSVSSFDFSTPLKTLSSSWQPNAQHPPLMKLMSGLTYYLAGSYRLAGNIIFILLVLSVFYIVKTEFDTRSGWLAALGISFLPRIFAHGHLVELDLPLALFWLLTTYSFYRGITSKQWSILTGVFWGLLLATKVTAVFIIVPLILWGQCYHSSKQTRNLIWMLILGCPLYLFLWPWLWTDTFKRIIDFYQIFFSFDSPLRTFYMGNSYQHTPWHYPTLMVLLTLPLPFIVYLFLGIYKGMKKNPSRDWISLCLLNIVVLIGIFSRPGGLVIDGIRYFMPVFPFIMIIAAYGFKCLMDDFPYKSLGLPKAIPILVLIVSIMPGLLSIIQLHPAEVSYYNGLIGGLSGAEKAGMEITYWGEVITPEMYTWLNENVPINGRVKILPVYPAENVPISALSFYPDTIIYCQGKGLFRKDINFFSPPPYDYLVLVSRQGLFTELEWSLYKNIKPVYSLKRNGVQLAGIYRL